MTSPFDKAKNLGSTGAEKITNIGAGDGNNLQGDLRGSVDRVAGSARSLTDSAAGTIPKGRSGFPKWIIWGLMAIVAVLFFGWLLSQCGSDEAATDTQATTNDNDDTNTENTDNSADTDNSANSIQADLDKALAAASLGDIAGIADQDGNVTLSGIVDTEEAKTAAEQTALGVTGVTAVDNQITVTTAQDGEMSESEAATINEALELNPITFGVNSSELTTEGQGVLDLAAQYLTVNADINIEIAGHTDSDGNDADNLALSQARAESVKAYLESKGIDGARMTPKGYGEAEPKVDNDTPENKAINRRIEFRLM